MCPILLGPAIGGAVFGFFLGMLVGLFEDLSIFLHIHEIFGAISQLPSLIGKLFGNPSMLVALFVDMITAHMTRCMLVNPYGTPPGTTEQWADRVAARFFGSEPGGTNVDWMINNPLHPRPCALQQFRTASPARTTSLRWTCMGAWTGESPPSCGCGRTIELPAGIPPSSPSRPSGSNSRSPSGPPGASAPQRDAPYSPGGASRRGYPLVMEFEAQAPQGADNLPPAQQTEPRQPFTPREVLSF